MFRQRMQEQPVAGDWFVSRVYELPVVTSAVGQLTSLYSGVKQHNRLFRFTLDTAEGGMNIVVDRARPVVAKFDKPIGALNTMACQQLEKLETSYPIITKPTDVVMKETRQLCDNAVKPLVDRVSAVKQYGVDKVTGVKTFTTDKINGVKEYGANTLSSVSELGTKQVNRVMETTVCRQVVTHLDSALNVADQYVDTYLPEAESEKMSPNVDAASAEERLMMCKACNLGNKVRRRMYARAVNRLKSVQLRSQETVSHFNFTVNLLEYSRGTVNSAKDKAMYVWTEVNKSEEDVAKDLAGDEAEARLHSDSTFERKALATARHLTQKAKRTMTGVGLPLESLPGVINSSLEPVRNLRDMIYISARNLPNVTDIRAMNGYFVHLLGEYQSLLRLKFASVFSFVVNLEPVKTMAPSLVRYVPLTAWSSSQRETKRSRDSDPSSDDVSSSSLGGEHRHEPEHFEPMTEYSCSYGSKEHEFYREPDDHDTEEHQDEFHSD